MRPRLSIILLLSLTTLGACGGIGGLLGRGSDPTGYQITLNREVFDRGNTGEVTIRNRSNESLEYNLCPRRLERRSGNGWTGTFEWPTAGGACTTEARLLSAGAAVNALFEIPTGLTAGTYRLVFTGLRGAGGEQLSSDQQATPAFQIR